MVGKFSEQFHVLVNEDVPRKFLKVHESGDGHVDETDYGRMLDDYDEMFPVLEDGFAAYYCKEH